MTSDLPKPNAKLYIVATPIGNLSDLTFRAKEVLDQVDQIACEDTRQSVKLLNHYGLRKPLLILNSFNERKVAAKIVQLLRQGQSVALLTDAGTPGVSDPGAVLVRLAREAGIAIQPVPGVSALASALSVSGCSQQGCVFMGFLRRDKGKIRKEIAKAAEQKRAMVFYESPYRIVSTLRCCREVLGGEAFCLVGREMTKMFEEFISGTLDQVIAQLQDRKILGEITVVLHPQIEAIE